MIPTSEQRQGGEQRKLWLVGRRRRDATAEAVEPPVPRAEISPVWEVAVAGQRQPGQKAGVLRRDARLRRSLATVDVTAAFAALGCVVSLIDGGAVGLRPASVLIAPLVLLTGKLIGVYDRDQHVLRKTTLDELPSLVYLSVIYALGIWLSEALFLKGWLTRPEVFALLLTMFAFMALGRGLVRKVHVLFAPEERCIVIGNASDAARVASRFDAAPAVNAVVIGRVGLRSLDEPVQARLAVPRLGTYEELAEVVADHGVERAIIAPDTDGQDQILDAIRLVKAIGVKVSVLPRLLEVVGSSSTFDEVDGISLLGLRPYGLARSSAWVKRAVDVLGAGLGLVILGPLLLTLTIAVKLDSPGPVFFRQSRIGRRGEHFWMLKFRSMVDGADGLKSGLRDLNQAEGGLFKITDDPRITRVGHLLRRTSLDELPQLINVLRGDMSIVGPRPLVPDEDRLIEGWQRRRLAVKPGMTGMWQIYGSSRIPMQEMVKIDYIYGANWSLWLDVRIVLRTIPYMLGRRGL